MNALAAFTVILLRHEERYLLLHRAADKARFPSLWSGIGGQVEAGEWSDLAGAALRELWEESGIQAEQISRFTLRRALLHNRAGGPLTVLLYFTGVLEQPLLPASPDGTLVWLRPTDLPALPFVENTREILPMLIVDERRDPEGREPVAIGIAPYDAQGPLGPHIWAPRKRDNDS